MTGKDWLLLLRAPLAASAASNVLVGALLAVHAGARAPPAVLALLAIGAACAYWAGMVWNDVFDVERDRTLAPQRPLPAGRISLGVARAVGLALTLAGVGATAAAGALVGAPGRGALAGGAVAAAVLGYDAWLKRYRWPGSLCMAACRGLNALVGPFVLLGVGGLTQPAPLLYAVALTVYVTGLTWLSTWEDEDAPRSAVLVGYGLLPLGHLAVIVALGGWGEAVDLHPLACLLLIPFVPLAARMARATLAEGTRAHGKPTTILLLKLVWLFDFTAVLAVPLTFPADAAWVAIPALWLTGTLGAKALFRRPPPPEHDATG